jgi:hypothetical protein
MVIQSQNLTLKNLYIMLRKGISWNDRTHTSTFVKVILVKEIVDGVSPM